MKSPRVRRVGAFAVAALLATLLVQGLTSSPAVAGPAPVMTGFIPLPANQFQDVMENVNANADSTLDFTVGITNNGSGSIMYYDHWEDGYEADIANPVQSTTEIWGDGVTTNGNAGLATRCGTRCAGDLLTPGDVFVLRNSIATPRSAATVLFDGRDKVASTRGVTITAGGFSTPRGPVLAGSVSSYDTTKYGTDYLVPVGQNTPTPTGTSPAFETSSLVVMAAQNATAVRVDANADGVFETSQTINQGEVVYIDGGVLEGARVVSDKPVQVHLGTGDVGSEWESRWFTLFPTPLLSSDYLSPVGSNADNYRTIIYLYNPTNAPLTITPTCDGCSGTLTVPAKASLSFPTPLGNAVRFQSAGNVPFIAVGGMGAQSGAAPGSTGDRSTDYDWGFTLVPTNLLTTQAILGWAPGNSNNPPINPVANRDDDPVWITSLTATTLHVDFDGDPTTGTIGTADCLGARHDQDIPVAGLASTRIFDATDGDMTGARIYTCDGTKIAGAWGEDPTTAPTGSPGFDAGYTLIPTTTMVVNKTAAVFQDVNGDGKMSPGDVIEYDIAIANAGNVAFASVNAHDVLPPGVVYQPNSTTLDISGTITTIADSAVPPSSTAFPLDETGASLPNIPAGASVHLKFRTTVITPRLAAGTVVQNVGCVDAVEDNAQASPVSSCDTITSQLTASDLSLVKSQTASPQYIGDNAVFHLVLANAGPDTATGVQVTDLLPAGTAFVGASASQGTYTSATGIWNVGSLASGASVTLDITATITTTTVTNYAQVTAATAADPDSQPGENPLGAANPPDQDDESSATVTVVPRADLELTKARTSGPDVNGNTTFLVTLTNNGPQAAASTVVQDTPPAGSSYVSSVVSTGTFTSATNQWSVPTLAAGASATLSITYDITSFPSTNFAQVISTGQIDPDSQPAENPLGPSNPPDQDDEAQAAIPSSADLSVTKTETSNPTTTGGAATFVVTVANAGPANATGVQVTDVLPTGLAYVSSSASAGSYTPGTGIWNVGSLAAGASATFTINAVVTQPGTITNTAELTSASPTDPDSTPNNHNPAEDDQASASVTTTAASIGDRVWFDVDNDGVQDAAEPGLSGVQVNILWAGGDNTFATADDLAYVANTDASGAWSQSGLPSGSYRVSVVPGTLAYGVTTPTYDLDGIGTANTAAFTLTGGSNRTDVDFGYRGGGTIGDTVFLDANANNSPDAGEAAAGVDLTVTWFGPNAAFGGGDDIVYAATTNASGNYTVAGLPAGTFRVVVDTADLPGAAVAIVDPDGGTDSTSTPTLTTGQSDLAQDFGYVVPSIDLSITKTDNGVTTTPGGTVAYTLSYANIASATTPATAVVLTETVPANSTFNAGASSAGWSCVASTCTLSLGTLAPGAGGSVTFAVTVANPVPAGVTQISNTAAIGDDGTHGSDPTPGNNTATDTTPVTAAPDLTVGKTDNGVSTTPGGTVAYTVNYSNVGNQGATGVVLTETVPANSAFAAGASTAGWSCVASTCTFAVGSLNAGASGSVTFAVTVNSPLAAGVTQLSNTATVADDGTNGSDPTPGNNTATDTTPVTAAPDLTVSKTDNGVSTTPGGTVAYTVNYSNVGNQGATGVVLTETVPANSAFAAGASTAGWSCVASTCTFAVGSLNAGASGSVTFAVTVNSPLAAGVTQLSNTATVADDGTNGSDPTPGNNTANDTTPIVAAPELSVTKTDGDVTASPTDVVVYTISYANNGSIGAAGVSLTETIPANTTFVAGSSSIGWSCGATTCTLAIGSLAAGASGSVSFAVRVAYPFPTGTTQVDNSVAIADDGSNGRDPIPDNDVATDSTPVVVGTVGDTVFLDLDGDGAPDVGEGIAGATIDVRWAGPNGTLGDGDDVTASTTTDADGQWSVTGLPDGVVRITVTPPFSGVANSVDPDGGNDSQSTVTLGAGESRLDQDFGYVGTGSIGDTVFLDHDGDGTQDAGESGVSGVNVTLLRDADGDGTYETTVGTTTTDGDGTYGFDELYSADYRAVVTVPTGLSSSSPTQVDHDLAAGQDFDAADFALLGATIGDTVWNDLDGDGVQDAGEPGIAGVTVTLLDDEGSAVTTTTTDVSGSYAFIALPAGTYAVQFGALDGFVVTQPDAGTEATDSDAAVGTSRTGTFAVAAGATVADVDAGFYETSSLAGSVFDDADGDGVRDAGESGIAAASVTLTGTDDLGDPVVLTTTTDANGAYSFAGLRAGVYVVTETQPGGYLDGVDSSGTAGGTVGSDTVTAIALTPGVDGTGYDFAELRPARIGDTVFSDTDGDGTQDGGEPGLGGVLVSLLLDVDGDGTYETTIGTTTSAGTGTYSFDDLLPGDYRVVVAPPSGQDPTTPTTVDLSLAPGDGRDDVDFGFQPPAPPQPGSIGDRVWNDADGDGAQDAGEVGVGGVTVTLRIDSDDDGSFETVAATQLTAADGSYAFTNLPPGSYQVVVTEPAGENATTPTSVSVALSSGLAVDTADFGLHSAPPAPGTIGDRVWNDANSDGVQDAGEPGIDGVTVTLLEDTDGDGVYETTVTTTTTSGDGGYSFTSVPPGTYRVVVTSPSGVTPSTSTAVEVGLSAGQSMDTADFGFAPQPPAPASIGDRVWSDSNHDGAQDAGEAGVNGVTVTLLRDVDGDGTYETTAAVAVTAGDGNYSFTGLEAGHYLVVVTSPPGMAPSTPGSIAVVVTAGDDVTDADVGLATPVAVPFDLELDKELMGDLVDGESAIWHLTVRNNGLAVAASPITVTDTLPTGATFVETADPAWTCGAIDQVVTCTLDQALAMGDEVTLELVTAIDTEPGTVLVNDASVAADGPETTLTNNTAEASGTVIGTDEPTPPTSTSTTSTTTPPSSTTPSTADGDPVTTTQGRLPATGSSTGLLSLIGIALLGAGVVLVALRRRLGEE